MQAKASRLRGAAERFRRSGVKDAPDQDLREATDTRTLREKIRDGAGTLVGRTSAAGGQALEAIDVDGDGVADGVRRVEDSALVDVEEDDMTYLVDTEDDQGLVADPDAATTDIEQNILGTADEGEGTVDIEEELGL